MHRKREIIEVSAIVVFALIVILLLSQYGRSHIVVLRFPGIKLVKRPLDAYHVWKEDGVRSRVLLLFDRHLNAEQDPNNSISPDSYIYYAVQHDLVRRIYHIVPDSAWPVVEDRLRRFPSVTYSHDVFRMILSEAAPVYIMRMRDIPAIAEPVLISINGDYWSDPEIMHIRDLLERRSLISDRITLSGHISTDALQALGKEYGGTS